MGEFTMAQGYTVPNLEGVHECYEVSEKDEAFIFTGNISADNIERLVRGYCPLLAEPCYMVIEVPTNYDIEQQLGATKTGYLHRDVYYCDGLSVKYLLSLFEEHKELLINDGMSCFGFGSHVQHDELFIGKYQIFTLFTSDRQRFTEFFEQLGIPQEENINTVSVNFPLGFPGTAESVRISGKSIYDFY